MFAYYIALVLSIVLSILLSKRTTLSIDDIEGRLHHVTYYRFRSFVRVILAMSPLLFVLCFRWNVGVDSAYGGSYSVLYQYAAQGMNPGKLEIGYYILSKLFAANRVPWFWFLFTLGLLSILGFAYGLFKSEVNPVLFILTFFFLNAFFDCFSSLRQSLAEGICVANLGWWISRKESDDKKEELKAELVYLLVFCLASLFHRIALIFVLFHIVSRKKFSTKNCVIACISGLLLSPVVRIVSSFMIKIFTGGKYERNASGFGSSYVIIALVVFCFALYQGTAMQEISHKAYYLTNYAMYTFILMVNSEALVLPFRFFDMLKISFLFTIPIVVKSGKTQLRRIAYFCIFAVVIGLWFWNSIYNNNSVFRQYQTAFYNWDYIIKLP